MDSKGLGFSSQRVNSGYSAAVALWAFGAFPSIAVSLLMIISNVTVDGFGPILHAAADSHANWEPGPKAVVSTDLGVCLALLKRSC